MITCIPIGKKPNIVDAALLGYFGPIKRLTRVGKLPVGQTLTTTVLNIRRYLEWSASIGNAVNEVSTGIKGSMRVVTEALLDTVTLEKRH